MPEHTATVDTDNDSSPNAEERLIVLWRQVRHTPYPEGHPSPSRRHRHRRADARAFDMPSATAPMSSLPLAPTRIF